MYSYKEWSKGDKIVRFYVNPSSVPSYVHLTGSGKVAVVSDDDILVRNVKAQLQQHLDIEDQKITLETLRQVLNRISSPASGRPNYAPAKKAIKQSMIDRASEHIALGNAAQNSLKHFADNIRMDVKTLRNVEGFIDTREAEDVIAHYAKGTIPCNVQTLAVGDIEFRNATDKTVIIIERKTASDFYQSITSSRAHSQAERLYEHAANLRKDGWRVMVCWLVIESKTQALYDILPETKQMDGMLNYLTAILGQFVFHVFNDQHGAYLANKLVQGFNELKLTYPVKNETGQRVDIPKKAMKVTMAQTSHESVDGHNVQMAQTNQLLYTLTSFASINMKTAKALAKTGKTLREILAMTEAELLGINGIGKTLAKKIMAEFAV